MAGAPQTPRRERRGGVRPLPGPRARGQSCARTAPPRYARPPAHALRAKQGPPVPPLAPNEEARMTMNAPRPAAKPAARPASAAQACRMHAFPASASHRMGPQLSPRRGGRGDKGARWRGQEHGIRRGRAPPPVPSSGASLISKDGPPAAPRAGAHAPPRNARAHYARERHAPPATGRPGPGTERRFRCPANDLRPGANGRSPDRPHDRS